MIPSFFSSPEILWKGTSSLEIQGFSKLILYEENQIVLITGHGFLHIQGEKIKIHRLESGELQAQGNFAGVFYETKIERTPS